MSSIFNETKLPKFGVALLSLIPFFKYMTLVTGRCFLLFRLKEELKHVDTLSVLSLLVELLTSQKYFSLAAMLCVYLFPPLYSRALFKHSFKESSWVCKNIMNCTTQLIITLRFRARRNLRDYLSNCVPRSSRVWWSCLKGCPGHTSFTVKKKLKLSHSINTDTKASTVEHSKSVLYFSFY